MGKFVNNWRNPHTVLQVGKYDTVTLLSLRDLFSCQNPFKYPFSAYQLRQHDPMCVPDMHKLIEDESIDVYEALSAESGDDAFGAIAVLFRALQSFTYAFVEHRRSSYPLLDRIRDMFSAVLFYRLWRADLVKRGIPLARAFMTPNAMWSFELSAHSFVYLVLFLHDNHPTAMVRPWEQGSQANEHSFRAVRACTGVESTSVCVNMVEAVRRLNVVSANKHGLAALGWTHWRHGDSNSKSKTNIQRASPTVHSFGRVSLLLFGGVGVHLVLL